VLSGVIAHVYHLGGFLYASEGGLNHICRRPNEGYHGSVGGFSWVYIEQTNAFNGFNGISN
jgi:hypothetical protein